MQIDGESVEQYISVLYSLAENCDYGSWKDEMIRDVPTGSGATGLYTLRTLAAGS